MQIARDMAGYTLGRADILRKAMGKKKHDLMEKYGVQFVKGCKERNITEKHAQEIYDLMAKFASYGFNKSHSAPYALLTYQTAYMKANYPVEFMAASMTLDMGNTDKLAEFRAEAERLGPADEADAIDGRRPVNPVACGRARRRRQEPAALVEANGVDADPRPPGEPTRCQSLC